MHYSLRVKVLVGNHEAMYVDMVVSNSSRQDIANTYYTKKYWLKVDTKSYVVHTVNMEGEYGL